MTLLGVDAAVIRMPDERGIELTARAVYVNDERVDAAARALLSRPQQLPRRELLALLERSEPLLLDADRAEALGGALALLAPFLRKGSSAAIVPIATPAELLATLTIVSLASRPPGRRGDRRHGALDCGTGRARDRQRPSLRAAEGVRRHDAALAPAARGARDPGPRARRRLRVRGAPRGRRRRLRLPHPRRRAARGRARRRDRPRRRRDGRHGDGEVRLPVARPRARRARRLPGGCERGRLLRDRLGTLHHDGRARDRLREGRGRLRERRPPAAASRSSGRHRRGHRRARARARDRRAAGVRDGRRGLPAGCDRRRVHGRCRRGASRRRAVRDRAAGRAALPSTERCRRRRWPRRHSSRAGSGRTTGS